MASDEDWVKAAKERCEAATPGPWDNVISTDWIRSLADLTVDYRVGMDDGWAQEDSDFVCAARTDLPRALAVIEAADRLEQAIAGLENPGTNQWQDVWSALAAYRKARYG